MVISLLKLHSGDLIIVVVVFFLTNQEDFVTVWFNCSVIFNFLSNFGRFYVQPTLLSNIKDSFFTLNFSDQTSCDNSVGRSYIDKSCVLALLSLLLDTCNIA